MFNSKSKKVGFFGTLLFHLGIILICFFSSIGYTSIEVPMGIEIDFVPYQKLDLSEEISQSMNNMDIENKPVENENTIEDILVEEDETIEVPHEQDTLTVADLKYKNNNFAISLELENALSKLNEPNNSKKTEEVLDDRNEIELTPTADNNINNNQDGYILSDNRLAVRKVKPDYSCEEFGKVVVRVWVNREGITIKAEPGIRGTTESASCLFTEAKHAALKTTWTPYFNAPEIQIGQITYNFHKY